MDTSQATKQQPPQCRYPLTTHKSRIFSLHSGEWKETYATSPEITMSSDERHAMQTLRKTISLYDNRYQLGLLWKPNANFSNNNKAAIAHHNRMKIQLNKNSEKLALYQNTIGQDLSKHYIRKLEPDEIPSTGWVLPEHGVIKPNKPGKLRRVSNAKSKFKGVCLNDMLLTGPDLLCNLLGVITRFRERKQPITADIEGMYIQVSVNPEDRKFFRFLWGAEEPEFFEYTRFFLGAKCSPTCAIYALRTCADDNAESHPHIKKPCLRELLHGRLRSHRLH